ncbi:hypothetical protein FACS189413_19820 [Bacteroidia bacterium]|nr:hypothetical protein FACS189413_19820 [Bacteroidia bacterium]
MNVANKIWTVPVNLEKTESLNFSLSYYFTYKRWSMNCMAMTDIPRMDVPYRFVIQIQCY